MKSARIAKIRLKMAAGAMPNSNALALRIVEAAQPTLTVRLHRLRKRYLLRRIGLAI